MHSSRMRTARMLTVSPSMLCTGGVYLLWGGVTGLRGYLVWGGVPGPGGVPCPGGRGYLVQGGVPGPGGTWSGTPPLWTESQTPVKT